MRLVVGLVDGRVVVGGAQICWVAQRVPVVVAAWVARDGGTAGLRRRTVRVVVTVWVLVCVVVVRTGGGGVVVACLTRGAAVVRAGGVATCACSGAAVGCFSWCWIDCTL